MKKFFILYPCCIPVKGTKRSTVCDLQRNRVELIPNALYIILTRFVLRHKTIDDIKAFFDYQKDDQIDDYLNFLNEKELGFFSDDIVELPSINQEYVSPNPIDNAIVDRTTASDYDIKNVVSQLSELRCTAVQFRFFYKLDIEGFRSILLLLENTTVRHAEVLCEYSESLSKDNLIKLRMEFPRFHSVILYKAPKNLRVEDPELSILLTESEISEISCGVINFANFISTTSTFFLNKNYNSCLYKKVAVDSLGRIKNCPCMVEEYGNVSSYLISDVVKSASFKKYWHIRKDFIQECKYCEFRYVCQDCRAFIKKERNVFSKPSKCNYSPKTGIGYPI